jgi:hypothetical protein
LFLPDIQYPLGKNHPIRYLPAHCDIPIILTLQKRKGVPSVLGKPIAVAIMCDLEICFPFEKYMKG